jgi:signal transduction histidine kinase
MMGELINSYALLLDKKMILDLTEGKLKEIIPNHDIYFLPRVDDNYLHTEEGISLPVKSVIVSWLNRNQKCLELSGSILEYINQDMKYFHTLTPRYIFPMLLRNNIPLLALICGKPITENQKQFLQSLFQLTALSYTETARFDKELQERDSSYQQKKMAMVGRMSSSLAHEIRNPLTSIRSSVQLLESVVEKNEMKEVARNVIYEVDRINTITRDMLNFAKPRQVILQEMDLNHLLLQVVKLYETSFKNAGVKFEYVPLKEHEFTITADEEQLKQVLLNLVNNALDAMENSKEKHIRISVEKLSDSHLKLYVADTGSGIREDILEHITEPFFTTKATGTGLGMAIVKQILDQHGFGMQILSLPNKGTNICIAMDYSNQAKKW